MNITKLKDDLIRHEGLRLKPYKDSEGMLTIGVGRNLQDRGISRSEALLMLDNDIREVVSFLSGIKGFRDLGDVRQRVLLNMAFNLGAAKLMKFENMWAAIQRKDFETAADEMLNSRWAKQVGNRAVELSTMMRSNEDGRHS